MRRTDEGRREAWRRAGEAALALCTAWLVIENLLLLALALGLGPAPALAAAGPLLRAAFTVVAPLWIVPVSILAVGLTAARLARTARAARVAEREVRRG